MKLTLVVPSYDDLEGALALAEDASKDSERVRSGEILVFSQEANHPSSLPRGVKLEAWPVGCGLPVLKNLGIQHASGELLLFLFPPLVPRPGAVDRLAEQMDRFPKWGGVGGAWQIREGYVEKGYNVRRFPTFAALVFDLLFIHKIFPRNRVTLRYKMLDFDHRATLPVEHVNDCAFMVRRSLALQLGGFNQDYQFGWFDQIEFCQALHDAGYSVFYDPGALFIARRKELLINRLLADRYVDFYRDERLYVARRFGSGHAAAFRMFLVLGMLERLVFSNGFPTSLRAVLIRLFRPYVGDSYIRSMRPAYFALLKNTLLSGGLL